ncbi:MAG TPA: hypothetical protein VF199_12540 [Bacillales bacterium]
MNEPKVFIPERLDQIYAKIEEMNEEIPAQKARMITLYTKALQCIAFYHADAVKDYGLAYSTRKCIWGETIQNTVGTAKDKEGAAETESYPARVSEAEAEAEVEKWKRLFMATEHIINALKIEHKTLMDELYNKNGGAG